MGSAAEGEKINKDKVEEFFDSTALLHGNENAVLDVGAGEKTAHANIYRDYFTKSYIKKYVNPSLSDTVLDFGCGVGRVTFYMAPFTKEIMGIDLSAQMIEVAKKDPRNKGNVHFSWLRNPPLEQADKTINKIFTHWVMQHIPDSEILVYLKEFHRLLKDKGRIYLFEQVKNEVTKNSDKHIYRTTDQYRQLILQSGYKEVTVTPVMRVPSRGMSLWNKRLLPGKLLLPVFRSIDNMTLNRKPQFANYYTSVFIFEKR